jgi:hypothetical protein
MGLSGYGSYGASSPDFESDSSGRTSFRRSPPLLVFPSCYYLYALSPPPSSISAFQSVSFGLQPSSSSLSDLVLSPQPHMM